MNLEIARSVSELMLEISANLDSSLQLVQRTSSQTEFETYRNTVGNLMGIILLEVMNPLYEKHPELKPPQLK
jgi:hypothetical protein